MPATMMHLYAGRLLCPDAEDAFYLGCILPDCVDGDRELKDRLHFRDVPPEARLMKLVEFGRSLSLEKPYDFGVLFHFYLDYLWDNGPQNAHRKRYTGDNWFRDYRVQLSRAGSMTARRLADNAALWHRLAAALEKNGVGDSVFFLPEDRMKHFMEFNVRFHTEEILPESEDFPAPLVDRFTHRAVEAYRGFLRDFFPKLEGVKYL